MHFLDDSRLVQGARQQTAWHTSFEALVQRVQIIRFAHIGAIRRVLNFYRRSLKEATKNDIVALMRSSTVAHFRYTLGGGGMSGQLTAICPSPVVWRKCTIIGCTKLYGVCK